MKTDIHPQYHPAAKVHCACKNHWITGSTLPELNVEICDQCHPFYTGKEKLLDTRGRIDKFQKRMTKSAETAGAVKNKKPRVRKNKKITN